MNRQLEDLNLILSGDTGLNSLFKNGIKSFSITEYQSSLIQSVWDQVDVGVYVKGTCVIQIVLPKSVDTTLSLVMPFKMGSLDKEEVFSLVLGLGRQDIRRLSKAQIGNFIWIQ